MYVFGKGLIFFVGEVVLVKFNFIFVDLIFGDEKRRLELKKIRMDGWRLRIVI